MMNSISSVKHSVVSLSVLFLPYRRTRNFLTFHSIIFSLCHEYILSKSSWGHSTSFLSLPCFFTFESSTYTSVSAFTPSARSPMNIGKTTGPRTDPCGIPEISWYFVDFFPFTNTCCCVLERKLWIHLPSLPVMPSFILIIWRRIPWSTLSKAFFKVKIYNINDFTIFKRLNDLIIVHQELWKCWSVFSWPMLLWIHLFCRIQENWQVFFSNYPLSCFHLVAS